MRLLVVSFFCAMCAESALADGKCMEFETRVGQCTLSVSTPVVISGDWKVVVKGRNVGAEKPSPIQFTWLCDCWPEPAFEDVTPLPGLPSTGVAGGRGVYLFPRVSIETALLPIAKDPISGTLTVRYQSETPEALRGLAAPVVELAHEDGTVITVTRRDRLPRRRFGSSPVHSRQ